MECIIHWFLVFFSALLSAFIFSVCYKHVFPCKYQSGTTVYWKINLDIEMIGVLHCVSLLCRMLKRHRGRQPVVSRLLLPPHSHGREVGRQRPSHWPWRLSCRQRVRGRGWGRGGGRGRVRPWRVPRRLRRDQRRSRGVRAL